MEPDAESQSILLWIAHGGIRRLLTIEIEARGLAAHIADPGVPVAEAIASYRPGAIVFDLDAGPTPAELVMAAPTIPILLLGAPPPDVLSRLSGRGLVDYVEKPFHVDELMERLDAIRSSGPLGGTAPAYIPLPDGEIDLRHHRLVRAGETVQLNWAESRLLRYFAQHEDEVVAGEEVLEAVWGPDYRAEHRLLGAYINRLRRKLGDVPAIEMIPGAGYRFRLRG